MGSALVREPLSTLQAAPPIRLICYPTET